MYCSKGFIREYGEFACSEGSYYNMHAIVVMSEIVYSKKSSQQQALDDSRMLHEVILQYERDITLCVDEALYHHLDMTSKSLSRSGGHFQRS